MSFGIISHRTKILEIGSQGNHEVIEQEASKRKRSKGVSKISLEVN